MARGAFAKAAGRHRSVSERDAVDQSTGEPLPVEKIAGRAVVGVRVSDRVVLFNPRGDRSAEPASFVARGTGL
jgi:hypothetical protein